MTSFLIPHSVFVGGACVGVSTSIGLMRSLGQQTSAESHWNILQH